MHVAKVLTPSVKCWLLPLAAISSLRGHGTRCGANVRMLVEVGARSRIVLHAADSRVNEQNPHPIDPCYGILPEETMS